MAETARLVAEGAPASPTNAAPIVSGARREAPPPGSVNRGRTRSMMRRSMDVKRHATVEGLNTKEFSRVLISVLFNSAAKGDIAGMERLIKKGTPANAIDTEGRTALHVAAAEGQLSLAKWLVEEHKLDVNAEDRKGFLPLDGALKGGHQSVVTFLREHGAKTGKKSNLGNQLREAVNRGDLQAVAVMLPEKPESDEKDDGLDDDDDLVNSTDHDGRTALMIAVGNKNADMVDLLLKCNANIHLKDRYDLSAYDYARRLAPRVGDDKILTLFRDILNNKNDPDYVPSSVGLFGITPFSASFLFVEFAIIILHGFLVDYGDFLRAPNWGGQVEGEDLTHFYSIYQDVHVMIFIGFGFLMTFLRKNCYQALGMTFLMCALTIQWYALCGPFFEMWIADRATFHSVKANMNVLIRADFCAGAVMITYGVILGKISPFQLLCITLVEVPMYAMNESLGLLLGAADVGGSMTIHLFGAVFGLTLSRVLLNEKCAYQNESNAAGYHSDIFSMVGTVFLWLFWPTFNSWLVQGDQQGRAIINTLFSLTGSCVCAFLVSNILRKGKKFCMVDAQNATLAGGVMMGSCADMYINPGTALFLGCVAGIVSVIGFTKISPILERYGIHDTCGVNNLHCMPSFMGAIIAMIAADQADPAKYGSYYAIHLQFPLRCTDASLTDLMVCNEGLTGRQQAVRQLAFTAVTIGMGVIGAIIAGLVASQRGLDNDFGGPQDMFVDDNYWLTPEKETPYYFDTRGEVQHEEGTDDIPIPIREEGEELKLHRQKLSMLEGLIKKLKMKKLREEQQAQMPQAYYQSVPQQDSNIESELSTLRVLMQKLSNKLDA